MGENLKLCLGCMHPLSDDNVCPVCGYSQNTPYLPSYIAPGTVLNERYLVGKLLKYNGESAEYIGYDNVTAKTVVVKEYMPDTLCARVRGTPIISVQQSHLVQYKAFMSEFTELNKVLAKMRTLNHINPAIDMFAENNTTYAVFEYYEGRTLSRYLEECGGVMTWDEVKRRFPPIFTTLSLVHSAGIIHRGISPETIFVCESGELKLTDFCIAASRTANAELATELYAGYAAPEQYSASGWQGTWTDVYAMSALLYRMLTGIMPTEAISRIGNDDLAEPVRYNQEIPVHVSNVIMNGLKLSGDARIQTITELVTKLFEQPEDSQTGRSNSSTMSIPKQTRPAPQRKKSSSYKIPLIVGTVTFLILGAAAIICLTMLGYDFRPNHTGLGDVTESMTQPTAVPQETEPTEETNPPLETAITQAEETFVLKDFVGIQFDLIKDSETYKNMLIFKATTDYNEEFPKGQIYEQNIPEGTTVPKGTELEVKVSLGSKFVAVPDFYGLNEKEYITMLDASGIKYIVTEIEADGFMPGYVCQTSKEPGENIDVSEGEILEVFISKNVETSFEEDYFGF